MLKLCTTTICDVTRLEAEGYVDTRGLGVWREALHMAAVGGAESVVIDVGRLTGWNVAAQAALVRAAQLARDCGRRLSVSNASLPLMEQARRCGLAVQLPDNAHAVRMVNQAPASAYRGAGGSRAASAGGRRAR